MHMTTKRCRDLIALLEALRSDVHVLEVGRSHIDRHGALTHGHGELAVLVEPKLALHLLDRHVDHLRRSARVTMHTRGSESARHRMVLERDHLHVELHVSACHKRHRLQSSGVEAVRALWW